jgi:hypothetical protein
MKKKLTTAGIILVIALLAIRAVYIFFHRAQDDRAWFLAHLDYNFRARIDSVITFPGRKALFLQFTQTSGKFDPRQERKLNAQMKQRTMKCITRSEEGYRILVNDAAAEAGDSLLVNSILDSLIVRRDGKTIFRATVSRSAYGKPWK